MRLSEIIRDPSKLRPENLWLWHPLVLECLPWVQAEGLAYPFLFGKKGSAASLRLPRNRLILRIARSPLEEWSLTKDMSLVEARRSCKENYWWDGHFRRWLQSLPLKPADILTRWARGETIREAADTRSMIKQLHRLDHRGMWRYYGVVAPEHLSVMDPNTGYYVDIRSYRG